MKTLDWILNRLGESSTWRGIILLLTSVGVVLDEDRAGAIIAAGLELVGAINVFRKQPASVDAPKTGGAEINRLLGMGLLLAGMCLGLATSSIGCKNPPTLETGGAYAPPGAKADYAFYVADSAFGVCHAGINGVFKYERDNRAALWKINPQIKHVLDQIRPKAWLAVATYTRLRALYVARADPGTLAGMMQCLAQMQELTAEARAALPQ